MSCPTRSDNPSEISSLFPTDTVPENRADVLRRTCAIGSLTPVGVTEFLCGLLGMYFSDVGNITSEIVRKMVTREGGWSVDNNTSGKGVLFIAPIGKFDPANVENRPAIVVKDNDWNWKSPVIGMAVGADMYSGKLDYYIEAECSHTVFAIANEYAECQILGFEVTRMLLYNIQQLRSSGLAGFVVVQTGQVSELKESTENYVVPVSVAYTIQHTWQQQEEAPLLKTIDMDGQPG